MCTILCDPMNCRLPDSSVHGLGCGLIPGQEIKIPHAPEQLSLHSITSGAHVPQLEFVRHNKRSCMMQQRSCVLQLGLHEAK